MLATNDIILRYTKLGLPRFFIRQLGSVDIEEEAVFVPLVIVEQDELVGAYVPLFQGVAGAPPGLHRPGGAEAEHARGGLRISGGPQTN